MKVELFTVYDQAATRFMDPFPSPTIDFALRGFKEACNTDGHQFNKYPEDYVIYHIGEFDPELGILVPGDPHKVGVALNMIEGTQLDLEDQIRGLG